MLRCEQLETRDVPAVLDIVGGALTFTDSGSENNNLTVSVSGGVYSFNDSISTISLDTGAIAAGWRGSGTKTVSGPATSVSTIAISVGGGTNTVNIKSILSGDNTTINGDTGTTTVNLNSVAPIMIGNLATIAAPVTVNAGTSTTLNVSDYLGTSRVGPVTITATSITNLAPNTITLSGTFSAMTVQGSNNSGLVESFVIDSPSTTYFRLYANGGNDAVTIAGNVTGDFYLGAGDDIVTVLAGVTLNGNVYGGSGINTYFYGAPDYGDITGIVI